MELHQLRYFIAVAETGNFTRAAERSFVAQPSLSQQIMKLEGELGHKLFHRLGRKAVLTEAGAVFLERARRILFEVEDAAKELRDDPALERTIVVGAIPTLAPFLLPQLLDRAKTAFPFLIVHSYEAFRADIVAAVVAGELDLALTSLPIEDHRLSVEPLFTEPLLLVVGRSHRLAQQETVTASDLAPETFVLLGNSSSLTAQIQRFCGDHDFQPKIGYRCAQISTVKSLVGLGFGISILPQVARHGDDRRTLVYRELSGRAPVREVAVVRHLQRYQSRGAEQFLRLVRELTLRPTGPAKP
ncbi:MAG TPA: LysR substrate-binding domain-containing protein [Opitutaceae bacterium]